jgi:hypothetical protein
MKNKELSKSQKFKLKAKETSEKFKRELRKSLVTALVAAFGFLIALSWREVITLWIGKISAISPVKSSLVSAIIITIISVIGILIISKLSQDEK